MATRAVWMLLLAVAGGVVGPSLGAAPARADEPPFPEASFPDPLPFDPEDGTWQTGGPATSVADPRAKKGGTLRLSTSVWPPTLRTEGPGSRAAVLSDLHALCYETLLGLDTSTMRCVPNLATHWQVDEDRRTFRFRLDPRARWADGREVTADDVVATTEHVRAADRGDPFVQQCWDDMIEHARALDRLTVEIRVRHPHWRFFVAIANGLLVYPAAYVRMDGETYLEDWNWRLPPGTGPYEIRPEDVVMGERITLRRRPGWWQRDLPRNRGIFNFDAIDFAVVRDPDLAYLKFFAGDLDACLVGQAHRWVEEVDREEVVRKGWVQKRRIHNDHPEGYGGFCFNLQRAPFDDLRVRKAFAHLFNREALFARPFDHQYEYLRSYFPEQPWERPGSDRIRFDPKRARALLAEAGWARRDGRGLLVDDRGWPFPRLLLPYASPGFERIFSLVRDDLRREAGIELELELVAGGDLLRKVWAHDFQLVYWVWTASLFPNPEMQFHSRFAGVENSNNIGGFRNEEADRLMEAYRVEFDPERRRQLLQRLDQILFEHHPYALGWFAPFFRILYWDRLGHPPEYCARTTGELLNVMVYWWYDPEKDARLRVRMRKGEPLYPDSPHGMNQYDAVVQRPWEGRAPEAPAGR